MAKVIRIMNMRSVRPSLPYDFIVDRTSPLGNPFRMSNEFKRDLVCDKYEEWMATQLLEKNPTVLSELTRIDKALKKYGKVRLFCWCTPKRCHAETIKRMLEN